MNAPHTPLNGDEISDAKMQSLPSQREPLHPTLVTDKRAERERVEALLAAKEAEAEAAKLWQMQEYAGQQHSQLENQLRREKERLERERAERRRLEEKIGTIQERLDHLERTETSLREGIAYLQGEVAVRDHQLEMLHQSPSGRAVNTYWRMKEQLSVKTILSAPYRIARATYHRLLPLDQRTAIRRALKKRGIG
jgi:predicted nuclease with TOPRIM domain